MITKSEYDELGFVTPFRVCTAESIARLKAYLQRTVFIDGRGLSMRHLDCAPLYDLCSAMPLVDAVATVIGDDVLLWRSRMFLKPPGGAGTPWHNDGLYFSQQLDPVVNLTAWIAFDDVDDRNACLLVIPGSHRHPTPHVPLQKPIDYVFYHEAVSDAVDARRARPLAMRAGECVLFNELLLHSSTPNSVDRPRTALSLRFTIPSVRIKGKGHNLGAVLVRGKDAFRINTLVAPPSSVVSELAHTATSARDMRSDERQPDHGH